MLKKLLKYDLEYIYKVLGVFYILAIIFALLTRLFLNIDNSFILSMIGRVCSGTTIAMIAAIIINNIMRLWTRFTKNFYGDESYLTHTLPVEKGNLYLSKFLASIISLFTSFMLIALIIFIAYYSKENIDSIKSTLTSIATSYGSTVIKILLAFLFVFFIQFTDILQAGYMGIILGHRQNTSKIVFSVIIGYVVYLGTQVFSVLSFFVIALFNKDFMNLFFTNEVVDVDTIKTILYMSFAIYTIILFSLYFINLKLFKKGVNVD